MKHRHILVLVAPVAGLLAEGVISYPVSGVQTLAVATGLVNPLWPLPVGTGKIAIPGLEGDGTTH